MSGLSPPHREWVGSKRHSFQNVSQMQGMYSRLVKKEVAIQTKSDVAVEEKDMLEKVFEMISSNTDLASFSQIRNFFSKCSLFYLTYNIRPSALSNYLNDYSRQTEGYLTRKEFLLLLNDERPFHLETPDTTEQDSTAVLSETDWQQLRSIFIRLDTFGRESVSTNALLAGLKNSHRLLEAEFVHYPKVKRRYTLAKVVFELAHKQKLQNQISWKQLVQLVSHFVHQDQPSLDIILGRQLSQVQITSNTNCFVISLESIAELKRTFMKCKKYCGRFARLNSVMTELTDSQTVKKYFTEVVRSHKVRKINFNDKKTEVTFEQQIKMLKQSPRQYMDMDEFLEYFTFRGCSQNLEAEREHSEDQSSEENLNLFSSTKVDCYAAISSPEIKKKGRSTVVQQFNFNERKESRRARRVQQMLDEKQTELQLVLGTRFKAKPIPASSNPEHFQTLELRKKEKKKEGQERQRIKQDLYDQIGDKLKNNSRLLDPKRQLKRKEDIVKPFKANPVPWHNSLPLLEQIEKEKLKKNADQKEACKQKYVKQWTKLPQVIPEEQQIASFIQSIQVEEQQKKSSVKKVPNFSALHHQFQQQLKRRKLIKKLTKVQKFKFQSPQEKLRGRSQPGKSSHKSVHRSECFSSKFSLGVRSPHQSKETEYKVVLTVKNKSMIELQMRKKAQVEKKRQEEKEQERQRRKRQKELAISVHKALGKYCSQPSENQRKNLSKFKRQQQKLKAINQREKITILKRVRNRPFLFQISGKEGKEGGDKKPHAPRVSDKPDMIGEQECMESSVRSV